MIGGRGRCFGGSCWSAEDGKETTVFLRGTESEPMGRPLG